MAHTKVALKVCTLFLQVDKIVIGKTYQASSTPSRLTRSRPTFSKTLGMPGTAGSQWCVEVWVATREGVSACIEIVDVLKKVRKPIPLP